MKKMRVIFSLSGGLNLANYFSFTFQFSPVGGMIIHLFPQELFFKSLIMFYIDTWN